MAFPWLAAATAVGSFLGRPKGKRPNIKGAISRFENARENAADVAFGERQRARSNEIIGQGVSEARANIARRYRARGLGGPAEDQALGEADQAGALARVATGRDTADLVDRRAQQRALAIFNAEVGQSARDAANFDIQQAGYWNSVLGLLPGLMGAGSSSVPSTSISQPTKPLIDELGADYLPT